MMTTNSIKEGDYIEEKWIREKKDFIKVRLLLIKNSKKVVSFEITKGYIHDTK